MNDKFTDARGWFGKADNDLKSVRILLEAEGPFDSACFHAQQAVEKYLKGVMVLAEVAFPFTHDLEELQEIGAAKVRGWPFVGLELSLLTDYAVELRYDFAFSPDRQQVVDALELAERVRALVLQFAPKECHP
ncbi:MAG: HEPN domain-containing protein [Terriglobia bacterium]|jgi:HEPN domain-containing protein